MGLALDPDDDWLPSLNAMRVPAGVDDGAVCEHLLDHYDIEVATGLGDLEGEDLPDRLHGSLRSTGERGAPGARAGGGARPAGRGHRPGRGTGRDATATA